MCRVFITCFLVLGIGPAMAHHGATNYFDLANVARVEGDIVSVSFRNPHVTLELRRTDDGGANELWQIEGASANALLRVGVGPEIIAVGDHVTITGALSRHGLAAMAGHVMTLADGTTVPIWPRPAMKLGQEVKPAPLSAAAVEAARRQARGIFRVWARPDLVGLFLEGGYLPFTPAAVAARAAWNPLTDEPVLDCIPRGMPSVMNAPLSVEFVDRGDSILMRLEEWDQERTIHLADAVDPETQPRTPLGYSVGRWEGNTLVVTTTRISDKNFDDEGTPQGADAVITERFTLSADETRLDYESIHDDPYAFAEPARQSSYWDWVPGEQIRRFDCVVQE
jgi:Family of unknown function (DUF6152)